MKICHGTTAVILSVLALCGCNAQHAPAPLQPPAQQSLLPAATPSRPEVTVTPTSALFIATDQAGAFTPQPAISRSRFVKINRSLLLDDHGDALPLAPNSEITLDLFPDVAYVGVIERIERVGDTISWVGHLKNVETSQLFIVYSAGVFIGHFASPAGVYEVSNAGADLYQIIQIDQSKLDGQGGEKPGPVGATGAPG